MIPPFDDYGNLPPGIHRATIEEVRARFGDGSPEREAQMAELIEFVVFCRKAGVLRIVLNGSFVTGRLTPQDVDVIVLPDAARTENLFPNELVFPFLQIITAADDQDLEAWSLQDFGTDRRGRFKGVIELII
jgi:hypothetical protein